MEKNKVKSETEIKTTKNNQKKKSSKKRKFFSLLAISILSLVGTLSVVSYNNFERIVTSVSDETLVKAKDILSLSDENNYKNYIENYQYTEKKYQEDLNKINQYEDKIYSKYKDYLEKNKFKDDKSKDEIISILKSKSPLLYFNGLEYFYMNKDYNDDFYSAMSIVIFHKDKGNLQEYRQEYLPKDENAIYNAGLKKILLKMGYTFKINSYVDNNKVSPNMYVIKNKHAVRYKVNNKNPNENEKMFENYFSTIKSLKELKDSGNLSQEDFLEKSDEIYENYILKILNNKEAMKETLKLIRATNEIVDNFYELRNNNLKINKGFIDDDIFIAIGFSIKGLVDRSEVADMLNKTEREIDYYGYFNNDLDVKMELSGYADYLIRKNWIK